MRLIRIGEMHGGLSERVQRIERTWREAGFNVKAFADIDLMIWEKFLCNVTLSAPTAAFDLTVGELMENSEAWAVAIGCMLEAWQVGQAQGVQFGFDDPVRYVTEFAATIPDASPSMRLDQLARRRSEVDVINGAVVDLSRELGLTAPYNETLCAILREEGVVLRLIRRPGPRFTAFAARRGTAPASGGPFLRTRRDAVPEPDRSLAHDRLARSCSRRMQPLDLAARRLRETVDEVDRAREGVRGELRLDELLQLDGQFGTPDDTIVQHDVRLQHLTVDLVRRGDGGRLEYCGVPAEHRFDLERPDPVAGHDDDVVVTGREVEAAVVVDAGDVAGEVPATVLAELRSGRVRRLVIPVEPRERAGLHVDRQPSHHPDAGILVRVGSEDVVATTPASPGPCSRA